MTGELILIVEDDSDIVQVVKAYLEHEGFEVEVARDGLSGLQKALESSPALIVLDWMLPRLDGPQFISRLRAKLNTPVIMLTARGEASDRLEGFERGADDYLSKPFHPPELVARIKAVLRRSQSENVPTEPLERGDLTIDPHKRQVTLAGETLDLTTLEFELLLTLAAHPGRVFSRNELLDRVWGRDFSGVDRVVDVHVFNLRQKLEVESNRPPFILTVRGVGYTFTEEFS